MHPPDEPVESPKRMLLVETVIPVAKLDDVYFSVQELVNEWSKFLLGYLVPRSVAVVVVLLWLLAIGEISKYVIRRGHCYSGRRIVRN